MRSQLLSVLCSCLLAGSNFALANPMPADILRCHECNGCCESECAKLPCYNQMKYYSEEATAFCTYFLKPSTVTQTTAPPTLTTSTTITDYTTNTYTSTITDTNKYTTWTNTTYTRTHWGTTNYTVTLAARERYNVPWKFAMYENPALSSACGCLGVTARRTTVVLTYPPHPATTTATKTTDNTEATTTYTTQQTTETETDTTTATVTKTVYQTLTNTVKPKKPRASCVAVGAKCEIDVEGGKCCSGVCYDDPDMPYPTCLAGGVGLSGPSN